jgi:hypothetical protein
MLLQVGRAPQRLFLHFGEETGCVKLSAVRAAAVAVARRRQWTASACAFRGVFNLPCLPPTAHLELV